MTFTFLLFVTRKPTITPAEFKFHWNTTHVEVIKSIVGDAFPITHTRRYIARPAEVDGTWPSAVLVGTQEDFTYDGIAELTFEDESAFGKFMAICSAPEAALTLAKDEENFSVREKLKAVVLGDTSITPRE